MTTPAIVAPATVARVVSTDARPIIPRNRTNLWTRAEEVRDRLCEQLAEACERASLNPLLLKSVPSTFPAWVKFEAWQPQTGVDTTERSSALVTIEPKPYHRHEFEFEVTYTGRNKTVTRKRLAAFSDEEVQSLIDRLIRGGPKPSFRRFRETPLQFWRPDNKIEGLRSDRLAILMSASIAAGFATLVLFPLAVALWGVAAYLYFQIRKRKAIVRNDGKPDSEPRSLVRVDSWQAVLFNLGGEEAMVRDRFERALQTGLVGHGRHCRERVWYWGLDGKEERDQYVLTAGRGIVFCQIYRYGQDLYVGWDGHLNRGQWVEQTVASGIDTATGNPTSISRVVPGTQPTTEYDLIDLSCLMEWTHAQIVKLLKRLGEEKKIDQEIDFKIQRAERRDVAASGAAEASDTSVASKVRKAFQRTA